MLWKPSNLVNPALAAGNILLAAHSLGLGACYVYVKDSDEKPANKRLRKIDEMTHFDEW